MTLTQLRYIALIAQLGSVRAVAERAGVSEPAVSGAIASLRREFGDALFTRDGNRIVLTAGGHRLAARATQIIGLADETTREVREARHGDSLVRVAASDTVARTAAPALLDAFTRRVRQTDISLRIEPAECFADLLRAHRVDVILGGRPLDRRGLHCVPFLRFRVIVVASPEHPLARMPRVPIERLLREPWLTGPFGIEHDSPEVGWLHGLGVWPSSASALPSRRAAVEELRHRRAVACVTAHEVREQLRDQTLVRLRVDDTPLHGLWYASTVGGDRVPAVARMLQRFAATPPATQAVMSGNAREVELRYRPAVHVTLWSSPSRATPSPSGH